MGSGAEDVGLMLNGYKITGLKRQALPACDYVTDARYNSTDDERKRWYDETIITTTTVAK